MPKGTESQIAVTVDSTSYVWGQQAGKFGRFPAQQFKGADGATGANGTNGTNGAAGYVVTDNTGAGSDLLLNAGDVAYITYTTATSIPLHIQTVEGLYTIEIIGAYNTAFSGADADATLSPNNTTTTTIRRRYHHQYSESPTTYTANQLTAQTKFCIAHTQIVHAIMNVSTYTKSKHTLCTASTLRSSGTTYGTIREDCLWEDSSTAWTSLGTITFGFAQTGKVIIRRLI